MLLLVIIVTMVVSVCLT